MPKKLPTTPRSRVRSAIRQVFLRSRERAKCIKDHHNTCERCGRKGSVAKGRELKIQVHHKAGVCNWERVIDEVFKEVLCAPEQMEVLCVECHQKEHALAMKSKEP